MISKQINHAEGNLQLDKYSMHGIYQLEVTRPDGKSKYKCDLLVSPFIHV